MANDNAGDVTQYYSLSTPYPEEWPADLDDSDDSESETTTSSANHARQQSQVRYPGLGNDAGFKLSARRKSTKTGGTVQKDEPDPLGGPDTVVRMLKQHGLPIEDEQIRNQFLLSSTTFSPSLFLTESPHSTSTKSLLEGLDYLSRSIDQKSASLKVLVESNFERFVHVKAALDNIYTQMRDERGEDSIKPTQSRDGTSVSHKAALTEETDYGVKSISAPLEEVSEKAREVWGEALGGREREDGLKVVLDAVEKQHQMYEIGASLSDAIQQRDYGTVFELYGHARRYVNEAKTIADRAVASKRPLRDEQIHTIMVTGKMWTDVEKQIQGFKRDLWKRLSNAQSTTSTGSGGGNADEHMELISALLELGVDDNPVWVWLLSRYDYLKSRITIFCQRSKVEIETFRRQLANEEKPTQRSVALFLRSSSIEASKNSVDDLDREEVVELWECIHTFLKKLVSMQGGILGDVLAFWDTAQSFIDGSKQRLLPAGFEGESRKHHRLSSAGINDLKDGIVELINIIQESVVSLFIDPPPEDITPFLSSLQLNGSNVPFSCPRSRFKLDSNGEPPPLQKKDEPWDDFAFWPPHSNSLSGAYYLSKFLVLLGTSASEMADSGPVSSGTATYDKLKLLVGNARERSVRAICAAWNNDAELCKYLEDWTPDADNKDLTRMPAHFMAFENSILSGMQKILYISEAMTKPGASDVVTPPPAKTLQMVRTQFVTSVYKALSGLVENAEHPVNVEEGSEWVLPSANMETNKSTLNSNFARSSVDSNNRNVRILLTLSNLRALRTEHVPQLVTDFETSFVVKLTDESKTIQDVLGQIDTRLFQSYTKPIIEKLRSTILDGIASPDWVPATSRPEHLRPYVYTTMLTLVMVHTEVSTTLPCPPSASPSASITYTILTELLTQISNALLEAFMRRERYTLPALMQATLDTEFIAQTMSQYSTEAASQIQSKIYLELDRRTNNDARARLQAELGEMRGILKRLRESTRGEFACFKKPKGPLGSK